MPGHHTYRTWSQREDEIVADLRRKGCAVREIADALERTESSVRNRIAVLGVSAPADVVLQRRRETIARLMTTPEFIEARRKGWCVESKTQARRERARALALKHRPWLAAKKGLTPEQRQENLAKGRRIRWQSFMADVPAHLHDSYRALRGKGVSATEAKAMIAQEWLHQLRRVLRQIAEVARPLAEEQARQHNSFEAKLARVAAGTARVVPTFRPTARPIDSQRSLIGSSAGMAAYGGGV